MESWDPVRINSLALQRGDHFKLGTGNEFAPTRELVEIRVSNNPRGNVNLKAASGWRTLISLGDIYFSNWMTTFGKSFASAEPYGVIELQSFRAFGTPPLPFRGGHIQIGVPTDAEDLSWKHFRLSIERNSEGLDEPVLESISSQGLWLLPHDLRLPAFPLTIPDEVPISPTTERELPNEVSHLARLVAAALKPAP